MYVLLDHDFWWSGKNKKNIVLLWFKSFKSLFGSVVVVAFQSVFHSKKYVNNVILFFKNYF